MSKLTLTEAVLQTRDLWKKLAKDPYKDKRDIPGPHLDYAELCPLCEYAKQHKLDCDEGWECPVGYCGHNSFFDKWCKNSGPQTPTFSPYDTCFFAACIVEACDDWLEKNAKTHTVIMPKMTHIYCWGNNPKRVTMKGRKCKVLIRSKMNSILIEFEDGQRECVSRWSVRKIRS